MHDRLLWPSESSARGLISISVASDDIKRLQSFIKQSAAFSCAGFGMPIRSANDNASSFDIPERPNKHHEACHNGNSGDDNMNKTGSGKMAEWENQKKVSNKTVPL